MREDISSLFTPEPEQWGLRGDPFLWREMAAKFSGVPFPESAPLFRAAIEAMFVALTNHPVTYERHFGVARHAHGGMSSGCIAPIFWREQGIPLLLSRYSAAKIQN